MQRASGFAGFRSYAGFAVAILLLLAAAGVHVEIGDAGQLRIPVGPPQEMDAEPEYITYQAGQLPLVLSAPHGGSLKPASIPDRQQAVLVNDPNSLQLAREVAQQLESISGKRPHLVLNHLDRVKLDPNRSLAQGAQGNPAAIAAWHEFHNAVQSASTAVADRCGWGLYVEIHSHGEEGRWLELGYGLTAEDLDRTDEELADRRFIFASNVRMLALNGEWPLPELIRGSASLGGLLEAAGYRVTPSPRSPVPTPGYFGGGYGVYRHGSRGGRGLDAIQIEAPYDLLNEQWRPRLARALAQAILDFEGAHYGFDFSDASTDPCAPYVDVPRTDPLYEPVDILYRLDAIAPCAYWPRRFCPGQKVSRLEAAVLLWKSLHPGVEHRAVGSEYFADVGTEQGQMLDELWLKGYLNSCGAYPLTYCPQSTTTRLDLAMMALRLAHGANYVPPRPAPVAGANTWGDWWLAAAEGEGLLSACDPHLSTPCVERPVTRADWAAAVAPGAATLQAQ